MDVRDQLKAYNNGKTIKIYAERSARSSGYSMSLRHYKGKQVDKLSLGVTLPVDTDLATCKDFKAICIARDIKEKQLTTHRTNFNLRDDIQPEQPQAKPKPNLYDEMREFYRGYYTNHRSLLSHLSAVNIFAGFLGKNPPAKEKITKENFRALREYLLKYYKDQNSASKTLGFIAKFFNELAKDEVIQKSPAIGITITKVDKPIVFLFESEITALVNVNIQQLKDWANNPETEWKSKDHKALSFIRNLKNDVWQNVRTAWAVDLEIGLRISDIRKLRFCDFVNGVGQIPTQKTGRVLNIALSETAQRLVTELKQTRKKVKDTDLIFDLPRSLDVCRILYAWGQTAGIKKKMEFRLARRSLGSRLVNNSVPIYTARDILGHTKTATTERYYSKLESETTRAAINKLPKTGF